ncbi:MAG: hypothetical protein JWN56_391 [Sphingobacteriales bacterium]|nr:hypothetical protein [Sphingobacteriales bacterium]
MTLNQKGKKQEYFYLILTILFIITACANIRPPLGGPKDKTPPKVVTETPKNFTRNFASKKIEIAFDEFIKLTNEFSEVSISPELEKAPILKAKKENLEITFDQPLEKNTTYTVSFGKAIVDVNEGNVLKNYSYVFSTGDKIDSLSISGNVTSSLSKDLQKDVTVFIIPTRQDSIFGKKKASIFTLTDSSGNFKLKNIREDTYRIYALKEEGGGDRILNSPNDQIAFIEDSIVLRKDTGGIKLNLFKEIPSKFIVNERKLDETGRFNFIFNKPLVNPNLSILSPTDLESKKIVEFTTKKDSAYMWLPQITFDSINVSINDQGKPLDTLTIRRGKKDTYNKPITFTDNLSSGKLKPKIDLQIIASSPIASFDPKKITLMEDSLQIRNFQLTQSENLSRRFSVKYRWRPDKQYTLKTDDNAFTNLMGIKSKLNSRKFSLDKVDNYGSIKIEVSVEDTTKSYILQWMDEKNAVLRSDIIKKNTVISYLSYPAEKYHFQIVYDTNKNGLWDTGNVKNKLQPEKIYISDKEITIRPNWDMEDKFVIPKDQ